MAIEKQTAKQEINVGGLDFAWNLGDGQFIFEGEDAVLFWITSAMRTFFDTIEEVSGEEAGALVLEATGFRQGLVVGEYFIKNGVSPEQASKKIPHTYASAGWGKAEIKHLDLDGKTLSIELTDSWEYKINKEQGKRAGGKYLPAHYAGIFTGLLGTNIWCRVVKDQLTGDESTVVEYFPSEITVSSNIHQLARKKESEKIRELEFEEKTEDLQALVKEISSPIIPVLEGIVVVPLIGKYDESRSEDLLVKTLFNLPKYNANCLILDLTGLDHNYDMGEYGFDFIQKLGSAAALIGIETILFGISAELGALVTQSHINLSKFQCFQTLQYGIYYALSQSGKRII